MVVQKRSQEELNNELIVTLKHIIFNFNSIVKSILALLEAGASANAVDNEGQPALMSAVILDVVELLLQSGVNIYAVDDDGNTVLIYASRYGHMC